MAVNKKAASKEAAPKKVYFTIKGEDDKSVKYQITGKKFIFKGEAFNKEEASKNEALCASLVASGSPAITEV
jgi:hypothetical protein